MPQGVPDDETRLQVTALNQVVARLFQEGLIEPHAIAALVLPDEVLKKQSSALPSSRDLTHTTLSASPEHTSGNITFPYTDANHPNSPSNPASIFLSSLVPIFSFSQPPTLFSIPYRTLSSTSSPFPPTSYTPSFLAAARLDSFTLCLWFRMIYLAEFSVLLSYSIHEGVDDALTLGKKLHGIQTAVNFSAIINQTLCLQAPLSTQTKCLPFMFFGICSL